MTLENNYPELTTMKSNEIFVEGVRVAKDGSINLISIEKVILKRGLNDMAKALKSQLNADKVYMITLES